jgi:CheY-like chemotaxis protein
VGLPALPRSVDRSSESGSVLTATAPLLRVMLVDARPERRELIRHLVQGTGLTELDVDEAGSGAEAVELLDRADRDVAVVEIQMPVDQGLETIVALRRRSPGLRIVVCSFHADAATKERALGAGADMYLDKPVSSDSLKGVFRQFFPEGGPALPEIPTGAVDIRAQEQPQPTGA